MKENKNEKTNNVFTFPEKLSNLLLMLFVIVMVVIDTLVIVFLVPKVDYTYLPNYEERLEYDWMNPYFRTITNYYEDDDKDIYSSMTVTFCYFGVDTNHKATRTIGMFTVVDENDDIYYVGDLTRSTNTTYSTTSTPLSRLSKPLSGIKTIYGKIEYDQMLNGEKQKEDIIYMREDIIKVNKKDLAKIEYSDESEINKILTSFELFVKDENGKKKITNKFEFKGELEFKYHLDYQLFCVDKEGNIYDLIGIYNFANNYSRFLSLDAKIPEKVDIERFFSVFRIIDDLGEKTIYVLKEASQG